MEHDRLGQAAPAWSAIEPLGNAPSSIASLRGKVVVLEFWATWCDACRDLSARMNELNRRYGAQGLEVVGITTEDSERVAAFAQRNGLTYALIADPTGQTHRDYFVSALPTCIIIDKAGVVRGVESGNDVSRRAGTEELVRQLLRQPFTDSARSAR